MSINLGIRPFCLAIGLTEVQELPSNCLHREPDCKTGMERVGLRFYAGKGYEPDIKWIPTLMTEVVDGSVRPLIRTSRRSGSVGTSSSATPKWSFRAMG